MTEKDAHGRVRGMGVSVSTGLAAAGLALVGLVGGCTPADYRVEADGVAYGLVESRQEEAIGRREPFTIDRPAETLRRKLLGQQNLVTSGPASYGSDHLEKIEHWPEEGTPPRTDEIDGVVVDWEGVGPARLSLVEALQVAAANSRDYQSAKENVFRAGLNLDLEIDEFRNTYTGMLEGLLSTDQGGGDSVTGVESSADFGVSRRLESGANLAANLVLDLAQLLSSNGASSVGIAMDFSASIPLLRGSGRHIVTEPLTQAQRDLIYAIWDFEEFKRDFAVAVVTQYYQVLEAQDNLVNNENSYRNQVLSTRQTSALASEGRVDQEQLDQARQQELQARNSWVVSRQNLETTLDRFKDQLGLPTDARIEVDRGELDELRTRLGGVLVGTEAAPSLDGEVPSADAPVNLVEPGRENAGNYEIDEDRAVLLAFENRLDLRVAHGEVYDAQRGVYVAADALQAGLDLVGNASAGERRSLGSADQSDGNLRFSEGFYSAGLELDLPWERTAERNVYRASFIALEQAVRDAQDLEDQIKADVRNGLRQLLQRRQTYMIEVQSVAIAERRVDRTRMLQDLGRSGGSVRDINEALEALVDAQNGATSALLDYRILELELQRDMGVLTVNERGLYDEYDATVAGR